MWAAIAAARLGLDTLVVEQFNCLGGIATAGGHGDHKSKETAADCIFSKPLFPKPVSAYLRLRATMETRIPRTLCVVVAWWLSLSWLLVSCDLSPTPDITYGSSYLKGMNIFFMNSRNCYRPNDYESTLNELLSIGINTVFIVTFHYAENEASDSLFMTKESIPESTVCRIIDQTRSKGIEPVLKPHIDLTNDMPRYKIKPGDIQKWVDSYSKIAVQYAKISDSCGLNRFVVGTELDNIADSKAFSAMIRRDVRQAFKGELIYAASFDHFITTGVLEDFDAIGVNSYFNLCQRQNCSEAELTESWNYWLNVIDRVSILKRKPVYITEVGFYSRFGCTIDPGDWSRPGGVSYEEQAQAYEALLCQAYQFDNVKGIFWWNWELNNAWGNDSADFTPRNKLSVDIVRKYWN